MQNSQVAHEWVHGNASAKGSNFFAQGDRLYSYGEHFVACERHEGKSGTIYLINSDRYSPSTQRHLSHVYSATQGMTRFTVPEPEADCSASHRTNADFLKDEAMDLAKQAQKSRKYAEETWERHCNAVEKYNEYCAEFGIKRKEMEPLDADTMRDIIAKQKKAADKAKAKRQKELAGKIKAWINGSPDAPRYIYESDYQYLRVKPGNPDVVETTGGVTFPKADAVRSWRLIARIYDSGTTYTREGTHATVKFGSFVLDKVQVNGTLVAGCHKIEKAEILRFAKVIGMIR